MHVHKLVRPHRDGVRSAWPAVRFGYWRLSDGAKWSDINPAPGRWDFALLDAYTALAVQHGAKVQLNLGTTPRWASARPAEEAPWGPGSSAEPADMAHWEAYVRAVATRFKGKIHAYEIWNEAKYSDIERLVDEKGRTGAFYSGAIAPMVQMTRIAHQVIKRLDPGARIIAPSVTGETDGRIRLFLERGGGRWVDAISFHFYPRSPEKDLLRKVGFVRRAMEDFGVDHLELWNTESGYVISGQEQLSAEMFPNTPILTPEQAAPLVARALILGWATGVDRYFWYAWDDGKYGLAADRLSGAPNAAGKAFERVRSWLQGSVLKTCSERSGMWTCEVERREPLLVGRIVWRTGPAARLSLDPAWGIRRSQPLLGPVADVGGAAVVVDDAPLLLVHSGDPAAAVRP